MKVLKWGRCRAAPEGGGNTCALPLRGGCVDQQPHGGVGLLLAGRLLGLRLLPPVQQEQLLHWRGAARYYQPLTLHDNRVFFSLVTRQRGGSRARLLLPPAPCLAPRNPIQERLDCRFERSIGLRVSSLYDQASVWATNHLPCERSDFDVLPTHTCQRPMCQYLQPTMSWMKRLECVC